MTKESKNIRTEELQAQLRKAIVMIVELEINIEILMKRPPDEVVGRKTLSVDTQGRVTSSRELTAGEMIKDNEEKKILFENKVEIIEGMLSVK